MAAEKKAPTTTSYVVGFLLSTVLTLTTYLLVQKHVHSHHTEFSHQLLVPLIGGLAISQFIVQALCFLHLGQETKPRWKLLSLLFAIGVVLIVVVGSLWIMYNLNYNMMDTKPSDVNHYLDQQDGL